MKYKFLFLLAIAFENAFEIAYKSHFKEMVEKFELKASEKENNPGEYWDYVREMDEENKN